ncbi:hypothetical protein [Methylobacterium fujisawaense]|uniref:hypothetical protein n=1 Tax=Methylobacterium fujisawaense TaxID=107400 RepID=UPI00313EF1DD
MADNVLASFMVALGFNVNQSSLGAAKKSVADYERAVREAEKRIEDARWAGAKTEEEVAKLTRELNLKLAREGLERAKEIEKKEKEAAKRRKEDGAAFVKGMERMALAAAAAATAISYAVAKVAGSFDNLSFQAQRAGTSVQSLKALQYAFSQTGGSAQQASAAVDSFTTALRNNPGLRQFVKDLGVDNKLQGVDKLLATVEALNREPYEVAVRHAEMLGISERDYNLLRRQMEAVKQYRAEYDETTRRFGLNSEKAAEASQAFQRALTRLQATAGVLADKLMASLAPAIQNIVDRFQKWVDTNPGVLEKIINDIAKAIISAAEAIGRFLSEIAGDNGEAFLKRWDAFILRAERFARMIERIVYGVERLLKLLHLTSGTRTWMGDNDRTIAALNAISGGPGGAGGGVPGSVHDDRNWWQRRAPRWAGGRDAPSPQGGVPPGSSAGNLTALYEAEAKRAGIDPRILHGIRAGESLHSDKYDVKSDAQEDSYGPFQLNRRGGLGQEFEKETGLDLHDPKTIPAQVRWAAEHIKKRLARDPNYNPGSEWYGYKGLRNADPSWGDSGYKPSQVGGNVDPVNGVGGLEQSQGAATRNQAITDALQRQIVAAATAAGVNAEVYSGGQDESGPHRTGSHRHDHGNAADLKLYTLGADGKRRYLDMTNDADRVVMEKFIKESVKAGANGVGAAIDYMGANGIHVGGGSPSAWGAGGSSANAPDWVKRAHEEGMAARNRPSAPNVDPQAALRPAAPMGAAGVTNNSTSRAVSQNIVNNVTVQGSNNPREHGRIMESSLSRVHGLALANAQSAVA